MKARYKIKGMMCSFCTQTITKAALKVPGVQRASVNLSHEEALIEFDEQRVTSPQIRDAIADMGYRVWDAKEYATAVEADPGISERFSQLPRLLVSAYVAAIVIITMPTMFFGRLAGWLPPRNPAMDAVLLVVDTAMIFGVGWPILRMAFLAVRRGILNQHVLLVAGALGGWTASILALLIPAVPSFGGLGAMLIFAHVLGGYFRARVQARASQAVQLILDLEPVSARRVHPDGREEPVTPDQLQVGDRVLVRPGEKVPVDGLILEGQAALDESFVTGESMPVDKGPQETVIGGSLNTNGRLVVQVSKPLEESFLRQVANYVEESKAMKPPIVLLADKALAYYVPGVMIIAAAAFVAWLAAIPLNLPRSGLLTATLAGLSVLVIGYPCALGLATPLALMRGTGLGAERGVLFRGGDSFERLRQVDVVVMDKTGTLTRGKPRVTDVTPIDPSLDSTELLRLAAAAESGSEHPLAQAVVQAATSAGTTVAPPDDFEAFPGRGVRARTAGRTLLVGNRGFLTDRVVAIDSTVQQTLETLEHGGKTAILVADESSRRVLGIVALADTPRPEARDAIADLKRLGLTPVMLTGDNRRTALAVARQLGIDDVLAELLPNEKTDELRNLQVQGKVVCFVGDGVNDAPALAQADVGIAMGGGTDAAKESADVVVVGNNLGSVVAAFDVGPKTYQKIRQNLLLAFAYNGVGIPVAALGFLHPLLAVAAMVLSSLSIMLNSVAIKLRPPTVARPGSPATRTPTIGPRSQPVAETVNPA